ncbi:MAG: hypothetical protein NT107_08520 [Planctomycetota bacterium]|nr:hypothetical protein [Planctomycetota bacterium]
MSLGARLLLAMCTVAACAFSQGAAESAAGFQRVLWVSAEQAQDALLLQQTRALGFTAINLGPGANRAAVTSAGLAFYLDQPVGKGYLELRDAEWDPVRTAYEVQRDPTQLRRPACLQLEPLLLATAERAAAAALQMRCPELRFVALADEASATRHNQPLDVCRCDVCRVALVASLQLRYGTLQKLNAAWATEFLDWDGVAALTTDQVRRRELGGQGLPVNLRPFGDWLEFVDDQFARVVTKITVSVQQQLPGVPVGLTGIQAPAAFGGHDYAKLLASLSLLEPYDSGAAVELARSLRPAEDCYTTITLPKATAQLQALLTARLCAVAAQGLRGAVIWNADVMLTKDGPSAAGKSLQAAFAALCVPLDACAGASLVPGDLWLVESQSSVRVWWMLDSAADGASWVRRMPSYEAQHSTSLAARRSWCKLLGDLGHSPRFVAEANLAELLLQQRPRVLVLPATIALSDRCCQAIINYVQVGGVVLTDHSPALYDERLALRTNGGLDALFGIQKRSGRAQDLRVRQGVLTVKPPALVAEASLRGALGEGGNSAPLVGGIGASGLEVRAQTEGSEQVFLERRTGKGRAVYLNLPVCLYANERLNPGFASKTQDLRRRVRQVLQSASVLPPFEVRGEGLPTCLMRTVLKARDGRRILALRLDVLDNEQVLFDLAQNRQRSVQLSFPRPVQLRTLAGEDLGRKDVFVVPFDVFTGLFLVEGGS